MTSKNNDNLKLEHFKKVDSKLYDLILNTKRSKSLEIPPANPELYKENLYRSIVSQQLSVKAATKIFSRLVELTNNLSDSNLILSIPDDKYKSIGLSRQKISYIKDISDKHQKGLIDFSKLEQLGDDKVIVKLTQIKGVGKWTAEMFLIFSLGRPDVFSVGDLGLLRAV